jgi:hypothetical protein
MGVVTDMSAAVAGPAINVRNAAPASNTLFMAASAAEWIRLEIVGLGTPNGCDICATISLNPLAGP